MELSEKLADEVNDELVEMIEDENNLIETKVNTNKFAYLVIKHAYYNRLDGGFQKMNQQVLDEIDKIQTLEKRILNISAEEPEMTKETMREIICRLM